MLYPVPSNFINAIKRGHFFVFLNLAIKTVERYLLKYIESSRGHLDQRYKNTQSKKSIKPAPTNIIQPNNPLLDEDITQISERNHNINTVIWNTQDISLPTRYISTDQTGSFPIQPNYRKQYIMILYE